MIVVLAFVAEEEQDAIIEQQRKELEQKKKKEQEDSQTLEQTREHVGGVYLRNEFNFWNVYGIMNTSGLW